MKALIGFCFVFVLFTGCNQEEKYKPDLYFSKEVQTSLIKQSVRYSAKLPPTATHENKFSEEFNEYYDRAWLETDFRGSFPEDGKTYYFLMTRKARSIWPAREAIGGKLTLDDKNQLTEYEEIFRTWKMTEDSLNDRAFELFDRMINKEDLTLYRSKYKGDRYIEFPDDRYYFNKEKKLWSDRLMDSIRQTN
jgi:hypothetical protein